MTLEKIADSLSLTAQIVTQQADKIASQARELETQVLELRTQFESAPALHDVVIGSGVYKYNANLLSDADLKDIEKNWKEGNLVQVLLYADRFIAGYRIARIVYASGETLHGVMWGDNEAEAGKVFTILEPRKTVWGWLVYHKVSGV